MYLSISIDSSILDPVIVDSNSVDPNSVQWDISLLIFFSLPIISISRPWYCRCYIILCLNVDIFRLDPDIFDTLVERQVRRAFKLSRFLDNYSRFLLYGWSMLKKKLPLLRKWSRRNNFAEILLKEEFCTCFLGNIGRISIPPLKYSVRETF
jgi:hypothetical protein